LDNINLFKLFYTPENMKLIDLILEKVYSYKSKEDKDIEKMNELLDKGLEGEEIGWIESLSILKEANDLHRKLSYYRGQNYINEKIPDLKKRRKQLTERMIDYKS
jgi:hypothetical protein